MIFKVFVLCLFGALTLGAKFPTDQPKCKNGDSPCIIKVANEIMAKGKQGYPELGLPKFDPLQIEKLNIEQGGNGPVNLKIHLRNFQLGGLSKVEFTKIEGFGKDYDKAKMELRFKYPLLLIEGPYSLDGKVLVLPVQGEGIANLKFYDNDVVLKLQTKKVEKGGKNYLQVEKTKMSFDTSRVNVNFANLFNGNKELGDTTNLFFNENWKDILKEIKPAVSDAMASVFESLINNVFRNIPYDEMFN